MVERENSMANRVMGRVQKNIFETLYISYLPPAFYPCWSAADFGLQLLAVFKIGPICETKIGLLFLIFVHM